MNLKIEKLIYGGEGLGHHEGRTVFVPFVLPEEVVEVQPVERRKKFIRARVQQMITPSPARASPPCPHFGVCGGCHYQHIPYKAQLDYKTQILRETLARIGRIDWDGVIHTHASPPFAYRNRAQWKVRGVGEPPQPAIGYFQAGSATLCPVAECPVLSPRLAEVLAALRELVTSGQLPEILREVEAFVDSNDSGVLVNASVANFREPPAQFAATLRSALAGIETMLLHESARDRFELFGPGYIHYEAAGSTYRVGHLSFFQVNRYLVDDLVRTVLENEQGHLALDLYAGVGLFTIPLARQFEQVVGLEANPAAARDLAANIEQNKVEAQCMNQDAESFLNRVKHPPDLVVLDPPRAGTTVVALERLVEIAPARITYLSCDPATLARDLVALVRKPGTPGGYEIREMHVFDLFPQTYHIEALVRLERGA